jgi:hypothetical protein
MGVSVPPFRNLMAIDDPVEITLRQVKEVLSEESYLPMRLMKLGFSATIAGTFATMPAIAQILESLLTNASGRFEYRFLRVAEELNAQQKRIAEKIPDKSYYESEEFQTLIGLIIERLHTTHDGNKLCMFGDALANCGSSEFQSDDKEEYIRTLRDLSARDLQILGDPRLAGWTPHIANIEYDAEVLSSLSRLAGLGLVTENLKMKSPSMGTNGSDRFDAANVMRELLTTPPKRTYSLSPHGTRFLNFIATGSFDRVDGSA